jgi:hypothetical protein
MLTPTAHPNPSRQGRYPISLANIADHNHGSGISSFQFQSLNRNDIEIFHTITDYASPIIKPHDLLIEILEIVLLMAFPIALQADPAYLSFDHAKGPQRKFSLAFGTKTIHS